MNKYSIDVRYSMVTKEVYISFLPSNDTAEYNYNFIWQNDDIGRWNSIRRYWVARDLHKRVPIRNLALNKRGNRVQTK